MSNTADIWLNRVSPNKLVPNESILLNSLPKASILSLLTEAATYRDRYVITISSELNSTDYLSPASDYFTLTEWLTIQKVTLDKSERRRFDMAVSKLYLEKYGARPRIVTRPNEKGQYIHKSNGFLSEHTSILKAALTKVSGKTQPKTSTEGEEPKKTPERYNRGHYTAPHTPPESKLKKTRKPRAQKNGTEPVA